MSVQSFKKVIQDSVFLLKNYTRNVPIQNQINLKFLIQSLKALKFEELGLEKSQNIKTGIGVRNIFEKGSLRVTLYYLPPGQVMQLHNHPSMLVITYILKGTLETQNYSHVENMVFDKKTTKLLTGGFSFIDGVRTNQRNLHGLKGIEGTFFLDILFPDYNEVRQCLFFEQQMPMLDGRWKLRQVEPAQIDFYEI